MTSRSRLLVCFLIAISIVALGDPSASSAQDRQAQRLAQGQRSPEDLVSFAAETSFADFVLVVNLISERATGKTVQDPLQREHAIGVEVQNMYFLDALDLVLDYNGLAYRETAQFYVVEPARQVSPVMDADEAAGRTQLLNRPRASGRVVEELATLESREIQIHAVLFEVNQQRSREIGLDWGVFLDNDRQTSGGGISITRPRFYYRPGSELDLGDRILTPELIDFANLNEFIRFAEQNGAGETIANPFTTVQSGEEGRIQIGTDIPIQTRDFSGNTLTQFFSTGIIVEVTPTLIEAPLADTTGAPVLPFVHLEVRVEKSGAVPSEVGVAINRNTATTKVLLLDGEQTVIGGLYSTDETMTRQGVPILKDLPPWFFGLRYIFGRTTRSTVQKELLIIIQANVLDSIPMRAELPMGQDLLRLRREQIDQILQSIGQPTREAPKPINEQ
jgi:type IV pilus assembly protein PilQ